MFTVLRRVCPGRLARRVLAVALVLAFAIEWGFGGGAPASEAAPVASTVTAEIANLPVWPLLPLWPLFH